VITLEGQGFGNGVVYARATLLGDDDGRPTLDADLLAFAARNARNVEGAQELVLVAEEATPALLMQLPDGLTLAGVVAEQPTIVSPSRIPVITGVVDARKLIGEGSLVVVDAGRGRILVEPTAQEIARLQSGTQRARFRLGAANVPAQTQSGRTVAVWAMVSTVSEVEDAILAGADGILVQSGGDLLPDSAGSDEETLARLLPVTEAFGGGDIALDMGADTFGTFDPALLCRLASHCRLRWILHPESLPLPVRDLRRELNEIVQAERNAYRTAETPRLMAAHPILSGPDATADRNDYTEILVAPDSLRGLTFLDTVELPPLYALLPFDLEDLPVAITNGISGAVVPLSLVADAKDSIREQE
jgi:phosphohistidine swiveling domain-containing protein